MECVRTSDRVIVFVGHPEHKQWWRNVQADPEVTVAVDGRDVAGRAEVHVGDDPRTGEDLALYLGGRPRMARALGLPHDQVGDRRALGAVASDAVTVRIGLHPTASTTHGQWR